MYEQRVIRDTVARLHTWRFVPSSKVATFCMVAISLRIESHLRCRGPWSEMFSVIPENVCGSPANIGLRRDGSLYEDTAAAALNPLRRGAIGVGEVSRSARAEEGEG